MCRLQKIATRDYQESVTTRQTGTRTDARQSDPYVPLCFAGDRKTDLNERFLAYLDAHSELFAPILRLL